MDNIRIQQVAQEEIDLKSSMEILRLIKQKEMVKEILRQTKLNMRNQRNNAHSSQNFISHNSKGLQEWIILKI